MRKIMLSNGNYASTVEDFEQVMEYNDYKALEETVQAQIKEWEHNNADYKELYEYEERHSDSLYQQNIAVYSMIKDMKYYIQDAKRVDRNKMVNMLNEMLNQLDNY